ncbi:hypothetical protein C2G38_2291397 [Gigaspora rosea]|uniref:Uncharacterized protein n=1 Tax=Gigaspora rosea TaxID=44941 RepID=A0A397W6J3_9GLOM|nr:hypothetical protein C2G38_2291397 [Gigaspora rosea]
MQSEIDLLKQRIPELEAEKAELEAKNAEFLKQNIAQHNLNLQRNLKHLRPLYQDIIDDDSAETIHKERISSEIRERNRKKKLQGSHNNSTQSETSTMSTPESLDPKTVKKLWDQNQHKSQDKTSQSHKKKGTENIAQVIADGIQDNVISDESETRSFVSSNHMTEISATARRQNSDTISLLDLAQLFDKATNAEYYATKANQEETLC